MLGEVGRTGSWGAVMRPARSTSSELLPYPPPSLRASTLPLWLALLPSSLGNFQNQFRRRGQIKLHLEQLVFVETPAHLWTFRQKRKNGEPWAWNLFMQSGYLKKKKKRKPLFLGLSCLSHHDKANHLIQTEARERAHCSCQRSLEKRRKNSFHVLFLLSGMLFFHLLRLQLSCHFFREAFPVVGHPLLQGHGPLLPVFRELDIPWYHLLQLWFYSYWCEFFRRMAISQIRLDVSQGQELSPDL